MSFIEEHPIHLALRTLAAGALALGLAACDDQKPPAVTVAKSKPAMEQPTVQVVAPKKTPESDQAAADAALAARVKSALAVERGVNPHTIDIVASRGAVTLFGTADTAANRERIGRVASGVQGVTSVQNKLVIIAGS
jgi:hyperosmotically inducible periplasmic protein